MGIFQMKEGVSLIQKRQKCSIHSTGEDRAVCAAFIRKISDERDKKGSKQTSRDDQKDKGLRAGPQGNGL